MVDQQLDNPPVFKSRGISRRAFLKTSAVGLTVAATGPKIFDWLRQVVGPSIEIALSVESKKLLSEITKFRESLGLEGLPSEFVPGLLKNEHWTSKLDNYADALPEKNRSYSLRIFEVIQKMFGSNATRLVKGSKTDPQYPYGMSFEGETRFCNVSETVHNIPIQDQFTDFVLHEACGHGSDPAIGASYPPEILIRVEHGKWRALSKALSVPDQFLNNPGDLMFPLLKRSIGETVGRFMTGNQNFPIVDEISVSVVKDKVAKVTQARGKEPDTLEFNKAVCREIGEALITLLREGKVKFVGDLKQTYQDKMETACIEIYAEMVKYALLYSYQIQNNTDIIEGIKEVISAIRGNSEIIALRETIRNPSNDIVKRNEAEKAMIIPPESSEPIPTLSPEEQEKARKEQVEFGRRAMAFQIFVLQGLTPEILAVSNEQREEVQKFGALYHKVIQKYPMFLDTSTQQYDESFDPEMHIWEIRQVEEAMDSGFIRNLVSGQNISSEQFNEIESKVAALERFTNSSAF